MNSSGVVIYGVNYRPEPTGIGPYTAELAEHLAATGRKVQVVTTFAHYPQWRVAPPDRRRWRLREMINGVEVTRLRTRMPRPMNGFQRLLFELSYGFLAITQGPRDAEIVVGVIPGLGSGVIAAVHARLRRRRLVVVVQDLAGQGLKQSGLSTARSLGRLASFAEGWALRRADQVIAISQAFVSPILEMQVPSDRVSVLPNWTRVAPSNADWPRSDGPPVILHAGSMGMKQGLEQIIAAARLADQQGLPLHWLLVGDGSERARLEELASGLRSVEFRDPVAEADFPALMASADVLLLCQAPSNIDMSFPSKLTSYFSARRPVVAAVPPNGAVHELLRTSGAGLPIASNDPAALLEAIEKVQTDVCLRQQLVEAAAAHAAVTWDRHVLLARWERHVLGES